MTTKCILGLDCVPDSLKGCVLSIGNFDGVHLGHQRIISQARRLADEQGLAMVAMTFEPPPDLVLRPADIPERLTDADTKCRLLAAAGAEYVVQADSRSGLLAMTADEFLADVIVGRFAPRVMVEGPDFFFGRDRGGDLDFLRRHGPAGGFTTIEVEPTTLDFADGVHRVSSTLIRRFILEGNVADAARCMGRHYAMVGPVVSGQGQGRALQFPTANLDPGHQVIPAEGVYAGKADIDGQFYPAAVSIGNKPTLGPSPLTIEANLIGGAGNFYGRTMALSFFRRLREQRKFASVEELKRQISMDVINAREIYEKSL